MGVAYLRGLGLEVIGHDVGVQHEQVNGLDLHHRERLGQRVAEEVVALGSRSAGHGTFGGHPGVRRQRAVEGQAHHALSLAVRAVAGGHVQVVDAMLQHRRAYRRDALVAGRGPPHRTHPATTQCERTAGPWQAGRGVTQRRWWAAEGGHAHSRDGRTVVFIAQLLRRSSPCSPSCKAKHPAFPPLGRVVGCQQRGGWGGGRGPGGGARRALHSRLRRISGGNHPS